MKNLFPPVALAAAIVLAACQSPPPPAVAPAAEPAPAPIVAVKPAVVVPSPAPESSKPTVRLAARNPQLEDWKQRAAERIYEVNRKDLFEGRPEHLLRAVIVLELAVDRQGKLGASKIMRSPGIASLNAAALRSVKAASPLPPPPPALLSKGVLVYQETWLFRQDGRFQLRSLALAQE